MHVMFPGLSQWLSNKESACNAEAAGDVGSIPGSGRCPGEGHGNPVFLPGESHGQSSLVAIIHGGAKSGTQQKQLSTSRFLLQKITEILKEKKALKVVFQNVIQAKYK